MNYDVLLIIYMRNFLVNVLFIYINAGVCLRVEKRCFRLKLDFLQSFLSTTFQAYVHAFITYQSRIMELWVILEQKTFKKFSLFIKKASFLQFMVLNDICVVDWLVLSKRFEIVYNFFSYKFAVRLFAKFVFSEQAFLFSISDYFKSALWLEREVWDMFGVFFFQNPDLRRILTDYGFEGYPLRKDFPLTGYLEVRFDDENSTLVYEPVELAQNYRDFTFISP